MPIEFFSMRIGFYFPAKSGKVHISVSAKGKESKCMETKGWICDGVGILILFADCFNTLLGLQLTFDNMKRLGFRAAYLSTDKNAEARTKRSQTTEPQLFYIVCWA